MSGTTVEPRIFRAYDVRGRADTELTPDVARLIGRAYATHLRRAGGAATIVVGRDNRPSSAGLLGGFVEGARASGVDVVGVGLSPSPLLYFAAARWGMEGGCNVTGSHGGREVNGLKLLESEGIPLSASAIQGLRALIDADDFEQGAGAFEERDALPEYVAYLGERFALRTTADGSWPTRATGRRRSPVRRRSSGRAAKSWGSTWRPTPGGPMRRPTRSWRRRWRGCARRWSRRGPTWASRGTATATGWGSSMRGAGGTTPTPS